MRATAEAGGRHFRQPISLGGPPKSHARKVALPNKAALVLVGRQANVAIGQSITRSPNYPITRFSVRYAYAAPTMIFLIRSHGHPCEMLLVCVG